MKSFARVIFVVSTLTACLCFAAPKPAIVPRPGEWTMEVTFEHPQQIVLERSTGPMRFWYTIITVVNRTKQDVEFEPRCDLMTDTFQIIPAGKLTPPSVFEQVKRRHQNKYPFLEPLEKVDNRMLQGEDNARDIALIWPDFDARAKSIKLFIGGLSNETAVIEHPVAKDEAGEPIKVYLRKTLELNYNVSGDPAFRSEAKVIYQDKTWVMR